MKRTLSSSAVPKKYDEAYKRQAVEMVVRSGKAVMEVAEDLGGANTPSATETIAFA